MNEDEVRKDLNPNAKLETTSSHSNQLLPSIGEKTGPKLVHRIFKDTQGWWRAEVHLP